MTRWTFVSKVMSLLFNILSRFVIAFLPRSNHLLILWLVTICRDFGVQKNKVCHCFHCFPIYLLWSQFFECWVLSQLFEFPLTFIKKIFSSASLSAISVVSSAHLRLLKSLPAILIPACASSSLAFCMMYSA